MARHVNIRWFGEQNSPYFLFTYNYDSPFDSSLSLGCDIVYSYDHPSGNINTKVWEQKFWNGRIISRSYWTNDVSFNLPSDLRVELVTPFFSDVLLLPAGTPIGMDSPPVSVGRYENANQFGACVSGGAVFFNADYIPPPTVCDSISSSVGIDLEDDKRRGFSLGEAFSGLNEQTPTSLYASYALVPAIPVTSVAVRSLGLTVLRQGSVLLKFVRSGAVLLTASLVVEGMVQLVRWVANSPIFTQSGDELRIEYLPSSFPTVCPSPPSVSIQAPQEVYPSPKTGPYPQPLPASPEISYPQPPDVGSLDPCCAVLAMQLYQISDQLRNVSVNLQWGIDCICQRLAELQGKMDMVVPEDLIKELKLIRNGVYHVEPNGDTYPLALEILGILNGLGIHLK